MLRRIFSLLNPYRAGAVLRYEGLTPMVNPPLGVSGIRTYGGLVDLVGPASARGLLTLFSSPFRPIWEVGAYEAQERAEAAGCRPVVGDVKAEFERALEHGPDSPRPVSDYLLVHAPMEPRQATLETGLVAMLGEVGLWLNRFTEEAVAAEVVRLGGWIEDPARLPIRPRPVDEIFEEVFDTMFEVPDPRKYRELVTQLALERGRITSERYHDNPDLGLLALEVFRDPIEIEGLIAKVPGLLGFSAPLFGHAFVERQYGMLVEHFTRFHEALHVADLMRAARIDTVMQAWGHPILTPLLGYAFSAQREESELAARYYDWQMVQRFFRGNEAFFLRDAVSVAQEAEHPDDVLRVGETYFRDLWETANMSLFDFLVQVFRNYRQAGVFERKTSEVPPIARRKAA